MRERVKAAFTTMGLSRHVREAVISEMRHQLEQFRQAYQIVEHYEDATGRTKTQLIKEAAEAEDRRHVLKVNGTRENLLDIAARVREAQRTMKAVERRVKATGEEFGRSNRDHNRLHACGAQYPFDQRSQHPAALLLG